MCLCGGSLKHSVTLNAPTVAVEAGGRGVIASLPGTPHWVLEGWIPACLACGHGVSYSFSSENRTRGFRRVICASYGLVDILSQPPA